MPEPVVPTRKTPLSFAHEALGARIAPFAGYAMPLHYPSGVLAEHRWTRTHAGLFDVSHMGVAFVQLDRGSPDAEVDYRRLAELIEPLVCGDLHALRPGELRYSLLLNETGGIVDDLLVGRPSGPLLQGSLLLVVNAATKERDFALIAETLGDAVQIDWRDPWGMMALQGPEAASVLEAMCPGVSELGFMQFAPRDWRGQSIWVSRSGYTGEDGFEILVPPDAAPSFWDALLQDARVRPVGLAARDSLRLEAGLPLYGHDLGPDTSPIEAGLGFAVHRRRREAGNLRGHARLAHERAEGPSRIRVGLRVLEGAPAREGAVIARDGEPVGVVTSGGFSPTLGIPIAMGFVPPSLSASGTRLEVIVRDRAQAAEVVPLPFVPHRYVRHTHAGDMHALHTRP